MKKNIFVPALEPAQRAELETIKHPDKYAFHNLLDEESLVTPEDIHFQELLERARTELDEFPGNVDGIIAHWDFPTSILVPVLCAERGIPAPSLRSVVTCEHKYWSRLKQRECIPENTPAFSAFDPFSDDPLSQIDVAYPFWVKPAKGFASQLGFRIENETEFREALQEIRENVHKIGDSFEEVLTLLEVPPELQHFDGCVCLAEQIIEGAQLAPEGTVFQGSFNVHGIFDMLKDPTGRSIDQMHYPSAMPPEVRDQACNACERFLSHIGFDNGCFNAEFMWDQKREKLWIVEVNTRISQSHSEMFILVDGMSNHEVAIDIALGIRPSMTSQKTGRYSNAAKCPIPWHGDGIVKSVPSEEKISQIKERFPGTDIRIDVTPGQRLSELPNQDSYRFVLGTLYIGANSRNEISKRFEECLEILELEIEADEPRHLTAVANQS